MFKTIKSREIANFIFLIPQKVVRRGTPPFQPQKCIKYQTVSPQNAKSSQSMFEKCILCTCAFIRIV